MTDWVDTVVADCRAKMRRHGFTVIGVGANPEEGAPQFAYTVGVSTLRGFEFAISGLSIETMHSVLGTLARRAHTVELTPRNGLLVEGVLTGGFNLRMQRAHPKHRFGMMRPVLRQLVPPVVWQAQFPDIDHRFPGDEGCALGPADQTDFTVAPATQRKAEPE